MNRGPTWNRRRDGFTLVELLVVIAIIGILAALILPAINRAREAGRRTQCRNNIRQLAMAAIAFEGDKGRYPYSGVYGVYDPYGTGQPFIDPNQPKYSWVVELLPYIEQQAMYDSWNFTIARPGVDDDQDGMVDEPDELLQSHPNWNWASGVGNDTVDGICGVAIDAGSINPEDLDNAALSHKEIELLNCPNDDTSYNLRGGLSYGCNTGYADLVNGGTYAPYYNWSVTQIDWNGNGTVNSLAQPLLDRQDAQIAKQMGVFWAGSQAGKAIDEGRSTSAFVSSSDGLSQTIMFCENINVGILQSADPSTHGDFTWAFPWTGASGVAISSLDICPGGVGSPCNNPGTNLDYTRANTRAVSILGYINSNKDRGNQEGASPFASSFHGDIVNVAMCDGSARAINDNIDSLVYVKLFSPQGGKLPKGNVFGFANSGLWQAPLSGSDF